MWYVFSVNGSILEAESTTFKTFENKGHPNIFPFMKKVVGHQSILYNGAKIWNDIPVEICCFHNSTSFRSKLKKYLISKY